MEARVKLPSCLETLFKTMWGFGLWRVKIFLGSSFVPLGSGERTSPHDFGVSDADTCMISTAPCLLWNFKCVVYYIMESWVKITFCLLDCRKGVLEKSKIWGFLPNDSITKANLTVDLVYTRGQAEFQISVVSFNPHNNPTREVVLSFPF